MLELLKGEFQYTAILRDSDFDVSLHMVFIMAALLCNSNNDEQHKNVASQRLP